MKSISTLPLVLLSVTSITAHFGVPFLPGFGMMPMGFRRMRRPCKMGMMGMMGMPFGSPLAFGGGMGSPLGAPFAGGMMAGRGSLAVPGGMGGIAPGMLGSPGVAGTTIISSDVDSGYQLAGGRFINTDNTVIAVPNGGVVGGQFINTDNSVVAVPNGGVVGGQFINTDNSVVAIPSGGVVGGNSVVYLGDAPDPDVTVVG